MTTDDSPPTAVPKVPQQFVVSNTVDPVANPEAAVSTSDSPNAPMAEMSISDTGEVSLDFRDADIQNVLKILSYKSGVNIVAGPEVTGVVTIKL